jgi:Fic family protein
MAPSKRQTLDSPEPRLPETATILREQWQPRRDGIGTRRDRQSFEFDAFVPGAIADYQPRLEAGLVVALNEAERACLELNEDPPALLSLEALARQLLRAEAVASSRIEGLIVSHRKLARAFFKTGQHDTAAEVAANVRAAERAIELAATSATLSRETLIEIHTILFAETSSERLAGLIREEQNWVGGSPLSPRGAEFVPPPARFVEPALADLVDFINRNDLPATLQAAIAHAQFETIHPFWDGNGRVGRALIHAILKRRGVAPRYVPPISLVLAGRADDYVKGLMAYRFGSKDDWYSLFAEALATSALKAREFADRVSELQKQWVEKAGNPRPQAGARKLIVALPAHPVVDVVTAQAIIGAASQETARQAIIRLTDSGVLRPISVGKKRDRLWESVGLFDLLDAFERDVAPDGRAPHPSR